MPAPILSAIEADHDVADAVAAVLSGKTYREAAAELGIPPSTLRDRINRARAIYRETYIASKTEELIAEQLLRLEHVQREAMLAWHRSIGQVITRTTKTSADGDEKTDKIETQAGDPRYLDTYLRAEQRRADLLGLDAPKRVDLGIAPGFIGNPERAAEKAGMTLEDAHALIEAALGGEVAS